MDRGSTNLQGRNEVNFRLFRWLACGSWLKISRAKVYSLARTSLGYLEMSAVATAALMQRPHRSTWQKSSPLQPDLAAARFQNARGLTRSSSWTPTR